MPARTFLFNDAADSLSLSLSLSAGRKKYDVLTFLGRHPQPSSSPSSFLRPSIPSLPSSLPFRLPLSRPSSALFSPYPPRCFPPPPPPPLLLLLSKEREQKGKRERRRGPGWGLSSPRRVHYIPPAPSSFILGRLHRGMWLDPLLRV